jgi:hypothetical protein
MSQSYAYLLPVFMCLCFGGLFAVVVAGIFYFVNRSVKGLNRTWGDLGMSTGLTLKPGALFSQPELNGTFRQRPMRVYTYNAESQGHRNTYTAVALTIKNPNQAALEVTPSGTVGNLLGRMVKAQDVEIGNPEFDGRFVIKSNPTEFAVRILGEARLQSGIMEIPGAFRIEVKGPSLEYSKGGLEDNAEFLTKLFNTLSDMADRVEELQ